MTELSVWDWKPSRWFRFKERWTWRLQDRANRWLVCTRVGHDYYDDGEPPGPHCYRCFKTLDERIGP